MENKNKKLGAIYNSVGEWIDLLSFIWLGLFVLCAFRGLVHENFGLILACSTFINYVGKALAKYGAKIIQPTGEELIAKDLRAPVFFLRSFRRDDQALDKYDQKSFGEIVSGAATPFGLLDRYRKQMDTFEELIGSYFGKIGPFVAIGNPEEKKTILGASRFFVSDVDWQAKASELVAQSAVIILLMDDTPGLRWELMHVSDKKILPKVILITAPLNEKIEHGKLFYSEWEAAIPDLKMRNKILSIKPSYQFYGI